MDVRLRIRRNSKVRDICCPRTYFNIVLSHAAYNPQGFAVHMFVPCKLSSKCSISPYVSTVGRSMSRVWLRMLDDFWSHLRPFVKFVLAVPSYRQLRRIDLRTSYRSLPPSLSPPIGERDISYFWFRRDPGENCESHGFQSQLSSHHFSRPPWFLLSTDGRLPRFLYRAPRNVIFPGRASRRLPIFAEAIIAHRPSNCPFGLVLFVFLSPRVSSLAARSSSAILSWIPKLEQPIFLAFVPSSSSSFSTRSFAFSRLASIFASTKRNRLRTYRRVTRWWFVFEL